MKWQMERLYLLFVFKCLQIQWQALYRQRYLQYDDLKAREDLEHFGMTTFGETENTFELSQKFLDIEQRPNFQKFYNLPELMKHMCKRNSDIRHSDILNLPVQT